jgi:hypothetical protein
MEQPHTVRRCLNQHHLVFLRTDNLYNHLKDVEAGHWPDSGPWVAMVKLV